MTLTWTACRLFIILTFLTGVAYPLCVTGIARLFFPHQAEGSLIDREGKVVGSEWIGQNFKDEKFFWPRPSAVDYNPLPSGGSNLAATSKDLLQKYEDRKKRLETANGSSQMIPQDLLFASASGLDPHISPEAALYQLPRIQGQRKWNLAQAELFRSQIQSMTQNPSFGIIGEKRLSVLQLNLALKAFEGVHGKN